MIFLKVSSSYNKYAKASQEKYLVERKGVGNTPSFPSRARMPATKLYSSHFSITEESRQTEVFGKEF